MEIILTRQPIEDALTEEVLAEIRAAIEDPENHTPDMLFRDVEAFKVGGAYVLIKMGGLWFNWKRSKLGSIIVDGVAYPLRGDSFLRINCVTSPDDLVEQKKKQTADAQTTKDLYKTAYDVMMQDVDERLEKLLDKLDKESTMIIGPTE